MLDISCISINSYIRSYTKTVIRSTVICSWRNLSPTHQYNSIWNLKPNFWDPERLCLPGSWEPLGGTPEPPQLGPEIRGSGGSNRVAPKIPKYNCQSVDQKWIKFQPVRSYYSGKHAADLVLASRHHGTQLWPPWNSPVLGAQMTARGFQGTQSSAHMMPNSVSFLHWNQWLASFPNYPLKDVVEFEA